MACELTLGNVFRSGGQKLQEALITDGVGFQLALLAAGLMAVIVFPTPPF
jgi:hypothetical protein